MQIFFQLHISITPNRSSTFSASLKKKLLCLLDYKAIIEIIPNLQVTEFCRPPINSYKGCGQCFWIAFRFYQWQYSKPSERSNFSEAYVAWPPVCATEIKLIAQNSKWQLASPEYNTRETDQKKACNKAVVSVLTSIPLMK